MKTKLVLASLMFTLTAHAGPLYPTVPFLHNGSIYQVTVHSENEGWAILSNGAHAFMADYHDTWNYNNYKQLDYTYSEDSYVLKKIKGNRSTPARWEISRIRRTFSLGKQAIGVEIINDGESQSTFTQKELSAENAIQVSHDELLKELKNAPAGTEIVLDKTSEANMKHEAGRYEAANNRWSSLEDAIDASKGALSPKKLATIDIVDGVKIVREIGETHGRSAAER